MCILVCRAFTLSYHPNTKRFLLLEARIDANADADDDDDIDGDDRPRLRSIKPLT